MRNAEKIAMIKEGPGLRLPVSSTTCAHCSLGRFSIFDNWDDVDAFTERLLRLFWGRYVGIIIERCIDCIAIIES